MYSPRSISTAVVGRISRSLRRHGRSGHDAARSRRARGTGAGDGAQGARGGPARSSVTLRYESAGLGRVDLSLAIEDGAVRAVAHAPAGEVASRLRSASGDLRAALAGALGRPASVDIVAHMEVLDVSA